MDDDEDTEGDVEVNGVNELSATASDDEVAHNARRRSRLAEKAVYVGKAPTSESYLNVEAILRGIDSTGAKAVHPGYGFLSEDTKFAATLESKGVTFIGPNSDAIIKMGDKIESKRIADGTNVSFIPGYDGEIKNEEHCVEISQKSATRS